MADDLQERIEEVAEGPAQVSGDAGTVVQPDLSKLIEADRYLAAKQAATKRGRGLRFTKLVPPGGD